MNMCSGFYKVSQLIYVDQLRAVIVFNNDFNVRMALNGNLFKEASQAFSTVLGHEVRLEIIAAGTSEDKAYREAAAKGGSQPAAPSSTEPPVTPTASQNEPERTEIVPSEEGLPKWDKAHMTEEERNNPLLAAALENLSENNDIYMEKIEDDEEET